MKNPILQLNPLETMGKGFSPLARFQQACLESFLAPDALPPGAHDPFAEPVTLRKPPRGTNPVILLHGTWANRYNTWKALSLELSNAGFSVSAINYGDGGQLPKFVKGYGDIRRSAKELARFVDEVLRKTGASKVDLVGHAQGGGVMPRWYIKYLGGKDRVGKLIGLAPSNHGTTTVSMGTLANMMTTFLGLQSLSTQGINLTSGKAAIQQSKESPENINPELDRDGDTEPGITYVVLATALDEVLTPWRQSYLKGGFGSEVTNVALQDFRGFEFDLTEHLGITNHPVAIEVVKRALTGQSIDPKDVNIGPLPPMVTP
ncbi:esterase/lipase family protein [Pendulispora albinea]|uniref:Alpha/beta fold hydrolase n=1 Tax=Pendulispora albinea TaxID=2741071 RepID=A0ABZ2LMQ9_9BACT